MLNINDEAMKLAAQEPGTTSKVAEQRASRLMLGDLLSMDLDLDEATTRDAWRVNATPTGERPPRP